MSSPSGLDRSLRIFATILIEATPTDTTSYSTAADYVQLTVNRATPAIHWTAPAAIRVEGGSFGLQIGGASSDVIMLVMNQHGLDRLMSDKFTIGADATAAAGPVGRTAAAETDVELHAEMLTWSRARGAFAGVSLNGATMRPDDGVNKELYGKKVSNRELLASDMAAPAAAQPLITELDKYSPRK
jgi:lipid-binding SYLF domain-containing protein